MRECVHCMGMYEKVKWEIKIVRYPDPHNRDLTGGFFGGFFDFFFYTFCLSLSPFRRRIKFSGIETEPRCVFVRGGFWRFGIFGMGMG